MLSGFLTCYWHLEHSSSAISLCEAAKYAVCKIRKYYLLHIVTLVTLLPFFFLVFQFLHTKMDAKY